MHLFFLFHSFTLNYFILSPRFLQSGGKRKWNTGHLLVCCITEANSMKFTTFDLVIECKARE